MNRVQLLGKIRSKFLRDTATLQIAGMLNQGSQVISTVLIAAILGAYGQGLFVSAIALQALIYFLINVGVTQTTVSQIAAARARDNAIKVAGWLAFVVKIVLLASFTILLVGWFLLPIAGEILYEVFEDNPSGMGRQIGHWAWLLSFQPLLELPRTTAAIAFQGTRRMFPLGQVENGQEVVRLFLVVLGATITGSPLGAILGHLGACAIGSLVAIDVYKRARRDDPGLLPSISQIIGGVRDVPILRGVRMSLRVGLLKNGQALFITVFPRLIIGSVVGVDWVAYFHIAQRLLQVPLVLMMGVTRVALPALGEIAGQKDLPRLRRVFTRVTLATGGLVAGGILGLLPVIPWLSGVLFPDGYAGPVTRFYFILALGYIPVSFATAIEAFYIATNNVRWWLGLTVVGAILTIPTNIWLILNVPYTGTAWGLSLYQSWVLVHLVFIAWWFANNKTAWGEEELLEGGVPG